VHKAGAEKKLELWYEFASTYSYLTVVRIAAVAQVAGVEVVWRPFLLGPIFREQGLEDSPFNLFPAKGRYMWRDVERLAQGYGLPFQRPSRFPRNGILAARVALLAEPEGWCPDFSCAVFHAEFALDRDIADRDEIRGLIAACGRDPEKVLAAAESPENKERLRAQTQRAQQRGIFGAPSLLVGDELYWGNDRLGEAIARAALG